MATMQTDAVVPHDTDAIDSRYPVSNRHPSSWLSSIRKNSESDGKARHPSGKERPALTALYRDKDAVVDIVAVHGLNGDSFETWTTTKTKKFWLEDLELLPSNLPKSRILTYSYNSSVGAWFGSTSSDTILHHAHTLVAELEADRQMEGASERPIIFICHSLGGILVKRALAYSASRTSKKIEHLHSIYVSTYAILFFATPHDGSSLANVASTALRIVRSVTPSKIWDSDKQLLDALNKGSEVLQNVTDMFAPLMKNFRIYFFWEQDKMDLRLSNIYIVEQQSAAPILDNTERSGLSGDHASICKFESRQSPGYRIVVAALIRYSREAPTVIEKRWANARQRLSTSRRQEAEELLREEYIDL